MRKLVAILVAVVVWGVGRPARAAEEAPAPVSEPHRLHAELDPLPFVLGGYGGQLGYRAAALPRLRFAVASFALDVPDAAAQLGDNEGFHLRVLPSVALYGLYFLSGTRGGFLVGGAARYLRVEYSHDDAVDAETRVGEFSLEAILAYKWHPFDAGFYLQPWLGLSRVLARSEEPRVGDDTYSDLPVQPFFTVNIGYELEL